MSGGGSPPPLPTPPPPSLPDAPMLPPLPTSAPSGAASSPPPLTTAPPVVLGEAKETRESNSGRRSVAAAPVSALWSEPVVRWKRRNCQKEKKILFPPLTNLRFSQSLALGLAFNFVQLEITLCVARYGAVQLFFFRLASAQRERWFTRWLRATAPRRSPSNSS
jgi:hypothetical protein